MKNKRIFGSIMITIFLLIILINTKAKAAIVEPELYFGISELRTSTNMGYALGNPDTGAEKIWKIVKYSNTNYNDPTEIGAYCLKADTGFANENAIDTYDVSYNMKTEKDAIAKQNSILQGLIEGGQYDNLLALSDLLYIKGLSTEYEREQLLEISGTNDIVDQSDFNGVNEYYITDDEIDVVQQAAIWYFTNYEDGGSYDKYGQDTWIWYTSESDNGKYSNFSSYNPTGIPYASATAGYYRQQQMAKLYDYLVQTAKNNADMGLTDSKTILTMYVSNQNTEAQPIMIVTKLKKDFDLSLRKYITKINDEYIENSRVPVIDETNLSNGSSTTAIYKHRKDPIEVKENDTIIYNITIYNEGEQAGRASQIIDQLPLGMEFIEVVSGSFDLQNYNTQTNTVYLVRKADNKENLEAYKEGNLQSETIQIKCKIIAEAKESDQILTNIAWISEQIDEDENVITNQVGDDRDSEPATITTQTKNQLVTTENGYIGNSNNNDKDLSNLENYFEGQQDDDDFEKVVIRAVTSVEVSKVWQDNSNQDGIRATEIKVELLKNGIETGNTITLNENNSWNGTFNNLPVKENGTDITYTVKETTNINGYTTNTNSTDSTGKSYTITNTHTPETISINVNKVWNDNNNQDGIRPQEIEIALKKGTETLKTVNLNATNSWNYVFTGLAKYENGEEIKYTVEETIIPEGYVKEVKENSKNNFTVTNTHTPETTSVKVNKVWNDANNQDGIRTESIEVELYKNGEATGNKITLNDSNSWEGTFDNLAVNENGKKIEYTVKEMTIEGYEVEISKNGENDYTIINTHKIFDLSLRKYITKVGDIEINDRIPNIRVETLKTGSTATYKHRKNPINVETGNVVIYNLTIYNEGEKIGRATKIEDQLPTGLKFNRVISGNFELESYSETDNLLKLKRTDNTDNLEPYNGLILDSETIQIECEVTAQAGNEDKILTNVAWISEEYDAEEDKIITNEEKADTDSEPSTKPNINKDGLVTIDEGYIGSNSNNGKDLSNSEEYFAGQQDDDDFEKIIIEAKTQITVTKIWNDNDNQDGIRPESIEIELYKNGEATGNKITLNDSNSWKGTFDNLDLKENGEVITYTVKEINVPEEYKASGDGTEQNSYTITNTYTPGETSVKVNKVWNDANNQDGIRPESIEVELYKNGEATGNKITLTENTWSATFDNLPLRENGELIIYTVKEVNVPEGYEVSGDGTIQNNYTITNTHIPIETSVKVNKVWNDNNNQDGIRPSSIEVQLIGTIPSDVGENILVVDETMVIREEDDWEGTFNNLPVNQNGKEIIYSINEITQIEGYTTEITDNNIILDTEETTVETFATKSMIRNLNSNVDIKNFTITNTHIATEFDLALRKFIVAISPDEKIDESDILKSEDGSDYQRVPIVDASKLNTTDENGNTITTAIYNHSKEPVLVKKNDFIIYMLRIYNEGEKNGYAAEIKDYLPLYLEFVDGEYNKKYGWELSEDGRTVTTRYLENSLISKPQTDENGNIQLSYVEVPILCKISEKAKTNEQITNIANITEYQDENKNTVEDRDSTEDNVEIPIDEELPIYKENEINQEYVKGQEDDDDFEKVIIQDFDLALRKFITKVNSTDVTTRIPEISYDKEDNKITYNHTKEPVEVVTGNIVEYTIRIYNEGEIDGYAKLVSDDIPEGLKYLPENETNTKYRWVMYDSEGKETENVEEAVKITTDYLSKEQEKTEGENLLKAFNPEEEISEKNPDYRDLKVVFEVIESNESDRIIINSAQISEDTDKNGDPIDDIDSIPDEWNEGEDDQDKEYIKLTYFDLALRKWVTEAIVIEDGKETIRQTGHTAEMNPEPVVKVELYRKNLNNVEVKFRYSIRVTNEGDIAGYAREITDYVPKGLKFVSEDNSEWTDEGNNVISTKLLENRLLQPGEFAEVEVLLTWINGEDNMGVMTNIAEISIDDNDKGAPDRDSIPDNQKPGEDDIDDAPVLISVETGEERIYYILGFTVLGTLAGGIVLIKKFVI